MRSTVKFVGVLCAVLVASALLGGCSTDDSALDNTFSCSGGGTTLRCISNTQYCEQAYSGSVATGARCLALPTGCSGSPCDNCLRSGTGGIIQCSSIAIGSTRATTVNVRN